MRLERCVWCGAGFDARARRLGGRTVCGACGVASTDPWPDPGTLEAAYADWYRPSGGRFSGPGDALLRRTRGLLAGRLDRIAPPGPVLDVGAGDGALLDALRGAGREAVGLERVSTRPDVPAGSLADLAGTPADLGAGRFAAIVFWHSLEHLPDPAGDLARAAGLLVPGGVIVIAVPNAASLQAAWFGDGWLALDLPRHLVHIPAGALLARLRRLGPGGMRVERVSYLRGGQAVFGMLHGLVGWLSGGRLDLYDAIRRPEAQQVRLAGVRRLVALAAGALLLPVAGGLALVEAGLRRGGTVYVEARRANADR